MRGSSRGGRIRTGVLLVPTQADWPGFPTPRILPSAQRESNPHIRHGKAVGCRYIMGTKIRRRIVKDSEGAGRVALESTSAALQAAATPSQLPTRPTERP